MRLSLATLALMAIASAGCRPAPARHPAATTISSAALAAAGARCSGIHLAQGLDAVFLGSGGARSGGRASSSLLVAIDGVARILVEAGSGAFVRLGEAGISAEAFDTMLLTQLSVDHASDLPAFVLARDLVTDGPVGVRIVGPAGGGAYPGTRAFVAGLFGPQGVFAYVPTIANELRIEPIELPLAIDEPPRLVFEDRDVLVSSVTVDHGDVPAVAYRIERAGHALVVTGDLAVRPTHLEELAHAADVLVWDLELRTPPERVGEIAARADVKQLVLSHLAPEIDQRRDQVLAAVHRSFRGTTLFAADCMHLPIEAEARATPR